MKRTSEPAVTFCVPRVVLRNSSRLPSTSPSTSAAAMTMTNFPIQIQLFMYHLFFEELP
jgi:hypothetical protein